MKEEMEYFSKRKIVIWGCGTYLKEVIDKIPEELEIFALCDGAREKWGGFYTKRHLRCESPEILNEEEEVIVFIAVKNKVIVKEIEKELQGYNIQEVYHINELVRLNQREYEKKRIADYKKVFDEVKEPDIEDLLTHFITINVPVKTCQLRCEYCYIGQTRQFEDKELIFPTPEYIRLALSRKRLGGTALLNFCGDGETLLCQELFDIIKELLKEGHYISIITNGLATKELVKYEKLSENMQEKIFFKFSFHYKQLKERGLLDKFSKNVQNISKTKCSYSVELVPQDEIINEIDEIKQFSLVNFGALPHLTVARDETKEDIPIISKYDEETYAEIWGEFKSEMFEMKMRQRIKRKEYCLAGRNSFLLSLDSGECIACPFMNKLGNIYDEIHKPIHFNEVGKNCMQPYCINNHAYIGLGLLKGVNEYTYYDTRNRTTIDGEEWVKTPMANIFKQRICDNICESGNEELVVQERMDYYNNIKQK